MAKDPILRRCIATNEMLDKNSLIRIVKNKSGEISIDLTGKKNGRGAYLSKSQEAIDKCKKNHLLDKAFKMQVPNEIYEELYEIITK